MERKNIDLMVGIFILMGVAALLVLALRVGNLGSERVADQYNVEARFENIGGLKQKAPVKSAGVVVGRVTDVRLDKDTFEAVVKVRIEERYQFPTDSIARILTSGVLGDQYIGIEPGNEMDNLQDGGTIEETKEAVGDRCAVAVRFAADEKIGEDGHPIIGERREMLALMAELPDLWDINIADYSQESLRRSIGQVLQEAFLFSDTVMNNLNHARQGATDEECITAAKQANAHDFIMLLSEGYDTVLTERGANLSQGQRQMITIARAMVANPKLLVLDEATSNVDTRTEKLIQEGLRKLMAGKTSFVVAHRLSTIQDSDQILVINKGEIIEHGTHDELMATQGFYYDLYMSQFKGKLAQFAAA